MAAEAKAARVIGGAGTGKTTMLKGLMEAALPGLGNDPLRLGFASFTRAARAEAVARVSTAWGVEPSLLEKTGWFRTVHSTVRRCLESKESLVADSKADIEWISEALGVRVHTALDDGDRQIFIGDDQAAQALNIWALARNSLMPLPEVVRRARLADDAVPPVETVIRHATRYESAKRMDGRIDFADMLTRFAGIHCDPQEGVHRVQPMGFLPEVGAWLFDEQQDASPLLDLVCKRLVSAPSVKWAYIVGDPFQSIYGFGGATADCFLSWAVSKEKTMPKSWRCPRPILELGERCLRRMTKGYFDRKIAPADHDGSVEEEQSIMDVAQMIEPGEDWLFIARTKHQASRLAAALHEAGKPCRWVNGPEGISARSQGLAALFALEHDKNITGHQWRAALDLLPVRSSTEELLVRGTKKNWGRQEEELSRWDCLFAADLESVGATPALVAAVRSGAWTRYIDRGQEWRTEAKRHGAELAANPRVRVGTIHSVKGAEADNVAMLTTIPNRVSNGSADPGQHDEECRVAYVAVTRARRRLVVITEKTPGRLCRAMEVV